MSGLNELTRTRKRGLFSDLLLIALVPAARQAAFSGGCLESIARCVANDRFREGVTDMVSDSAAKWVFLYTCDGPSNELLLRQEVTGALEELTEDAAVFDEKWVNGGALRYAKGSGELPFDLAGGMPSNLLIRRELLLSLLEDTLPKITSLTKLVAEMLAQAIAIGSLGESLYLAPTAAPVLPVLRGGAQGAKRVLVVSHELSRSGAPLVLAEACVNVLRPHGYQMMVLSPLDGPVAQMYLDKGIPVMIQPDLLQMDSTALSSIALGFDLVLVCTIVPYACIWSLKGLPQTSVMWWVHDCKLGYQYVAPLLPKSVESNVHVYCGGQYAKDVMLEHFPQYDPSVLLYGVKDRNPKGMLYQKPGAHKLLFSCIASVEDRKGQDVFARAIELLDEKIRRRCQFLFVGNVLEPRIYLSIERVVEKYPDQVSYRKNIPRDELDLVYQDSDCIVCSSRDDPMPAFVTEGLMFGKPTICSRNTGSAGVLTDGEDGFIYDDDDPRALAACIEAFVQMDKKKRQRLSKNARACYEANFTIPTFERNFLRAVEESMGEAEPDGGEKAGEKAV